MIRNMESCYRKTNTEKGNRNKNAEKLFGIFLSVFMDNMYTNGLKLTIIAY